ncbi:endo-1,3(4)-beta-glucanase [Paraphysoderma sedebokerense]|nr:endo-1,3(4)-beta-glucanase [Paraphysoderma sedebokerense]
MADSIFSIFYKSPNHRLVTALILHVLLGSILPQFLKVSISLDPSLPVTPRVPTSKLFNLTYEGTQNLLEPISTQEVSSLFPPVPHPLKPIGYNANNQNYTKPIPTNKFYTLLFLPDARLSPVFVHPYMIKPLRESPYGFGVGYSEKKVLGVGTGTPDRVQFYFNFYFRHVGFSALEFTRLPSSQQPIMSVPEYDQLSAHLRFANPNNENEFLVAPLVRGMAYVTVEFRNLTPLLHTQFAIVGLSQTKGKAILRLSSRQTWIVYTLGADGIDMDIEWKLEGGRLIADKKVEFAVVRVAVVPTMEMRMERSSVSIEEFIRFLDLGRSVYPVGVNIQAVHDTRNRKGLYSLGFQLAGKRGDDLLHYTLPHHRQVIEPELSGLELTPLKISSTTKGPMLAYYGNQWVFSEDIAPVAPYAFLPPRQPDISKLPLIQPAIQQDLSNSSFDQLDIMSKFHALNYFAGKSMSKLAHVCLVVSERSWPTYDARLSRICVDKLKDIINSFLENRQKNPLRYDTVWKGILGRNGLGRALGGVDPEDRLYDFGSSYYNDHHYHYGYFLVASAILHRLDPTYRAVELRLFIDSLARDVSNPSSSDIHFPPFRSFDFFSGHSWSNGIFDLPDGKDQESISEELNFHYGLKLWGIVTNRTNLENLGNLLLTMTKRSAYNYFFIMNDNTNHPKQYIKNKVSGILFEGKVDHATWFGRNMEFIHGIQMIPVTSIMEFFREPKFVREEWEDMELGRVLNDITNDRGWRSILLLNLAIIEKEKAWQELVNLNVWDDGLWKSWALVWAATRP